ncbi:GroES-like zinc-binding alcohol dehydrogenase family protein [Striga asiatica]|uniref:GroES-like zinc-binding alcohol dehydrogenase family protein n=1 Tax=Striga asiatica TaxID=4170 RepID=A0A5A7NWY4_STRAF|nr:GroES-like zinc-binding alcohol dehydrogenase family protein [Striga asiatica]GER24828.1 GroES-like zinc-binding alcohol dehydrogenase family protein [Striga asiatica]GER24830.1 GroES-like zinc-binding alcohol dehydrogenase family protein [Striga asiatica]
MLTTGQPVLKWEDVEIGELNDGEIRVKNKAIGLNFIDVYFRKGVYKAPTIPFTPGMEAVGVVTAVGPRLTGRKVGDVVAYAEDFVTRVNEITSGKGVEVVYDSVGKDTFEGSLECLKLHLNAIHSDSDELLQTASEVFTNVGSGILRARVVNHTYPLSQAAQDHEDLENRKMTGSVVLIPDGC